MHISLLQFVVYTGASTRVGSKHIPRIKMIPYSPVTEVNKGSLLWGGLIQMSKYLISGLQCCALLQCFCVLDRLNAHFLLIKIISGSDAYDVFNSASTTEITKLD